MGWAAGEDVEQLHEGYVVAVFADGAESASSSGLGIVVMHRGDLGNYTGTDETRPREDVVGWRVGCDCADAGNPWGRGTQWRGPLWERVATEAEQDLAQRRVWVDAATETDLSTTYRGVHIDERDDTEDLLRAEWRALHLDEQLADANVAAAAARVREAEVELDAAVRRAREQGVSWERIGQAAGMTRQSAHERWRRLGHNAGV